MNEDFLDKNNQNFIAEAVILADERVGTYSQAIALAENLSVKYLIIPLQYGFLSRLPNFFPINPLLRLRKSSRIKILSLLSIRDFPKIIISAGRKSAPLALFLKKYSKNSAKIVQIMRPELRNSCFDFVVLPSHDLLQKSESPNLITTIGAMNRINHLFLKSEQKRFFAEFDNLKKPIIALMIGGSSKNGLFEPESARKIMLQSIAIAKNMAASLLILTSPRTDQSLAKEIKDSLQVANNEHFKLLDWKEVRDENPYFAVIDFSSYFIISGDSVSMISECCSTGKPVYIFDEKKISSAKHRKFHRILVAKGYAKELRPEDLKLENYSAPRLEEAKRVAQIISQKIQF